jgi:hypothetical protein
MGMGCPLVFIFFLDSDNFAPAIGATAWADPVGNLELAAAVARYKVLQLVDVMCPAFVAARF